jgi:branched-chain amino acid transport system permease protein
MFTQLFINGLILGSIYALVAMGFGLIFGTTRFFNFAHGGIYASAAYLAYVFKVLCDLNIVLAAALSVLCSMVFGMMLELNIYKPLRRKEASPLILLISSLGVFIVIRNILAIIFGEAQRSIRTGTVRLGLEFLGARITALQGLIIFTSTVFVVILFLFLQKSKLGKATRAVASNPLLSKVAGIDVDRIILFTFAIGSVLAALAAVLIAIEQDIRPDMGLTAVLMGFVAVTVGGVGNIKGAFLGGFLVGLARSFGIWMIPAMWADTVVFVFLIFFLLIRPTGFGEK